MVIGKRNRSEGKTCTCDAIRETWITECIGSRKALATGKVERVVLYDVNMTTEKDEKHGMFLFD